MAFAVVVLALAFTARDGALAQESDRYKVDRLTIAATAAQASSVRYDMGLTFGEEGPVGSASFCNSGFLHSTGFWSVLGGTGAPIRLEVFHASGGAVDVDLLWTGSSEFFDVYRGEEPDDLVNPANLTQTVSDCLASDSPPIVPQIVYYLIVPVGG